MVLAIDNSFSMRQGDRLERAKREAMQVASALRPEDKLEVLAFGSQVQVLGDSPRGHTDDRADRYAQLIRRSWRARCGPSSGCQSAGMPVEAHLFSDMQKSSLPANFADLRLPDGVRLVAHPAASAASA